MTQVCSKCKQTLSFESFHKEKNRPNGRRSQCKSCTKLRTTDYYIANRERILSYSTNYIATHKQQRNARLRKKLASDPLFTLKSRCRNRIYSAIKRMGFKKSNRTHEMLGCNYSTLIQHLEETWNKNYPGQILDWKQIHVDHIIPLSIAKSTEDIYRLSHYSNLQLLRITDNLTKSNRLDGN